MEQKLNIAEILKNKPIGIKLYSPIFGDCTLCYIKNETNDICVKTLYDEIRFFDFEGRYNAGGECLLFPSKEMRDWSKFAWKKGNVLVSNDGGTEVIFDKWYDDTYTNFYSMHYLNSEDENNIKYYEAFLCTTERYSLEDKDAVQAYINTIEERLDGKLNIETLEIEKAQPEFKDGDILCVIESSNNYHYILIYEGQDDEHIYRYVTMLENNSLIIEKGSYFTKPKDYSMRYATEEEKQQLFGALEKEGKAWDSEKKQVVNLKPKCEFKPFDKVLCRDWDRGKWGADFFSHYDESSDYPFICIKGVYKQCIPYSNMTRHLLGITGEWKG